jgi:hypothetical protein
MVDKNKGVARLKRSFVPQDDRPCMSDRHSRAGGNLNTLAIKTLRS